MNPPLSSSQFEALRRLDTCSAANAIERFKIRLRNEGFSHATIRCLFPHLRHLLGYAATIKVRCSDPPPQGGRYFDRTDWWDHIASIPAPRVLVIEDVDPVPGSGAFLGEVHANVLRALHCAGAVTNGAVRDLPAVESIGFHLFAGSVSVSHAYVHVVEMGTAVQVAGLKVRPGDLLHGDQHGILSIPLEIAAEIPSMSQQISEEERHLVALCQSPEFSLEKLRDAVKAIH